VDIVEVLIFFSCLLFDRLQKTINVTKIIMQISKIVMTLMPTEMETTKNESFPFCGPPSFEGDDVLFSLPVNNNQLFTFNLISDALIHCNCTP